MAQTSELLTQSSNPRMRSGMRPRMAALLCALWLVALGGASASAQNIQHTENGADLSLKSDLRVDPSTLGMSITIPLASYPGRAGHGLPVAINYSSKVLRLAYRGTDFPPASGVITWTGVEFAEHSTAGWTSTLAPPRVEFTGMQQFYDSQGRPGCEECPPNRAIVGDHYVKRIHVHMPGGSAHELRLDDQAHAIPVQPFTGTFHAVDGSRMRFESNAGYPSILYLPDGSRYVFPAYNGGGDLTATSYEDRHGNRLDYDAATRRWTDTLGRVISEPLPAAPAANTETSFAAKLVGGTQEATYTFRWKSLADALTPDPVTGQPPALKYPGNYKCAPNSYQTVSPSLFTSGGGARVCVEKDFYGNAVIFNPVVLSEVVLPTGSTYRFTYTVYGEIDRVHLPTGGTESFTYAQFPTLSYTNTPYNQTNRGVFERRADAGGGAAESVWSYSVPSSSPYTVRATSPDGTYGERLLHRSRYTGVGDNISRFGFDEARVGMVYEERAFDAAGVMLRRSLSKWVEGGQLPGGYGAAARDPKVTKQVSIMLDAEGANALWSAAVSRYEQASQPLNQTSSTVYGYDSSMSEATAQTAAVDSFNPADSLAVRTTVTEYLEDPAYSARGLTALPVSSVVRAGAPTGAVVSRSETRYDESAFPLLPCGATLGRNDPGAAPRGNATTARSWLDTGNVWLETHAQYDACGNVRKTWDAKDAALQNPSLTDYSSAYQSAYPTTATSADPDGGGPASALATTTAYDLSTGRVISTTDANDQQTTFHFTDESGAPDPLNRLRKVVRPGGLQAGGGGQTVYSYGVTPGNLHVRTRTYMEASRFTDAYQYFDGLARPLRSITYENQDPAKPWLTADTEYDTSGRVRRASLPYRAAGGAAMFSTDKWAETEYDSLGRARTVTTKPDNASVKTDYSGDRVLVTDQAGRQRLRRADALGRMVEVWEVRSSDPASGTEPVWFPARAGVPAVSAGYRTSYAYDVLGNLRTVTQGVQTRTFIYDSLGRLTSAANPESGTVTYAYDANGNLQTKTDARGVAITHTYDALNRSLTLDYSDTGAGVDVQRYYDGATLGKGRLWTTWAGGPPSTTATQHTAVDAYDAAGRPLAQRQLFKKPDGAWQTYSVGRTYDLAGNVMTQTYPSGRSVSYGYDDAGRAASFAGNLGDSQQRTYSSEVRYSQFGGMEQERFGTQTPLYNKRFFNSRGQMSNVRLSTHSITAPGQDGNWNRGAIVNHYSDQSWAGSGTDNNGNLLKQELYLPHDDAVSSHTQMAQHYAYDELNRLKSVTEFLNNNSQSFRQSYSYDRFGNRTVDAAATSNAPAPQFEQDAANPAYREVAAPSNRLYAPGDGGRMPGQKLMGYDAAGNLVTDTYQGGQGGGGTRTYDAEGRMTSAQFFNGQTQTAVYTYDADGRRVRRKVGAGAEVWQVYGMGGELLAEYPAGAAHTSPQKEYGYRAGELLVTAEAGSGGTQGGSNPAYGGTPAAIPGTVEAERYDTGGQGVGHHDTTQGTHGQDYDQPPSYPPPTFRQPTDVDIYKQAAVYSGGYLIVGQSGDWQNYTVDVASSGVYTLEARVAWGGGQGGTFRVEVDGVDKTGPVQIPDTGWDLQTVTKAGVQLTSGRHTLRVVWETNGAGGYTGDIDYLRFTPDPAGSKLTPAAATASNTYTTYTAAKAIDGDPATWWSAGGFPAQWIELDLGQARDLTKVRLLVNQDPPGRTVHEVWGGATQGGLSLLGALDQTTQSGQWLELNAAAAGVRYVKVKTTLSPSWVGWSEVEVYGVGAAPATGADIKWLVSDQLGTPRMVVDQTGSLSGVKRHDYLPFGEEIQAGVGGRTQQQGYSLSGDIRQGFTGYEKDVETGLDFAQARYFSPAMGRFASPDMPFADQHIGDPQSWNLYAYTRNNPLRYTDPTGRGIGDFLQRLKNAFRGFGLRTDQEVEEETARRLQYLREVVAESGAIFINNEEPLIPDELSREEIWEHYNGITTLMDNGGIPPREPSAEAMAKLPEVVPVQTGVPTAGNTENLSKIAKRLRLNPSSSTSKQLLENLDNTCEQFINQFRKGNVKAEFPREFLNKTVKEALESKNSTVRKLLTDSRFAK